MAPTQARRSQRAQQKERTRQRLIEATMEVVATEGLTGTTLGKVAKQAGLSQGIVNFHFDSKKQLLCDTLTFITDEYRAAWQEALSRAQGDPVAQIEAVVDALLEPRIADHKLLGCWFAYWGDAYARGIYRRIGSRVDAETFAALEGLCSQLLARCPHSTVDSARQIADSLVAMVNGYWLMKLLRPDEVDLQHASRSCKTYLRGVFPEGC